MAMDERDDNLLDVLCTSGTRARILDLFFVDPSRRYYVRQVHQITGQAVRAVQRELARLAAAGILLRYEDGNRVYFAVDRDHPAFQPIRALVVAGLAGAGAIHAELAVVPGVRLAFIRETAAGYDVLVVGDDVARHRVVAALDAVDEQTDIRICDSEEFVRSINDKDGDIRRQVAQSAELLSRKDDLLWHRMKTAGLEIKSQVPGQQVQR